MQTVPTDPPSSSRTYERIHRMSSGISSPARVERSAASRRSSGDLQPPRRRITYVSMGRPPDRGGGVLPGPGRDGNRLAALCAVTPLEFLPRSAPAGVVAAQLLGLLDAALLDGRHRLELLGSDVATLVGLRGRVGTTPGQGHDDRLPISDRPAAGVRHATGAGGRPRGGVLPAGRSVSTLHLDLDVEDHPTEVR